MFNRLLNANLNMLRPLKMGVESEWKVDVDERGDECIKHVELSPVRPRGAIRFVQNGA